MANLYEIATYAGLDPNDPLVSDQIKEILGKSGKYEIDTKSFFSDGYKVIGDPKEIAAHVKGILQYGSVEEANRIEREAQEEQERLDAEREKLATISSSFMTTTGESFEGYSIVKYGGCISADAVTAVQRQFTNFGNNAWTGKSKTGNKLVKSLHDLRIEALEELKTEAACCGCNAVTGVSFSYITLDPIENTVGSKGMQMVNYQPYVFCVSATGTAVKIIEEENNGN